MIEIFDHTYHKWRNDAAKANGAVTYSTDLTEYQIPKWKQHLPKDKDIIISTASRLSAIMRQDMRQDHYDIAIQYLHTYPYANSMKYIEDIVEGSPFKADKWIFITAYKTYEMLMNSRLDDGYHAVHIPMSIDTHKLPNLSHSAKDALLYFGNIYSSKNTAYEALETYCKRNGIWMDTISFGKFNGHQPVTQEEIWDIAKTYKYGAGVGRCALEMMGIGLKLIVCGAEFGGIMLNEQDWKAQHATNVNGRIITTDRTFEICWKLRGNIFVPKKDDFTIGNKNHYLYLQEKGLI